MEFITENYLWIILIIIVVLMAVVGYVAEKKDFIKKNLNPYIEDVHKNILLKKVLR